MKTVILAACAISMITGILNLVKPNAKFDRQLRLMTSCVMAIAILTPLIQGIGGIPPDWNNPAAVEFQQEELENAVSQQTLSLAAETLRQELETALQQQKITASVEPEMYILEDGSIGMKCITVSGSQAKQAAEWLETYFNGEAEVIAVE